LGGFFNEVRLLASPWLCPGLFLVAVMIPASILSETDNAALQAMGSVAGCVACLFVPLILLTMFFLPAALLFAVAEQRFGAAFEFGRIWPFVRANIGNYLLARDPHHRAHISAASAWPCSASAWSSPASGVS
jgi:hypothetical protein